MSKLQLFAQLTKVDVANRRVFGVIASETPDNAGEIMDYVTSAPQFKKWSDNMSKASGGKNIGNVRVMHGLTAAGGLVEITFHDDLKKITACAEITDVAEMRKVEAGTYTGFSIGGKYLRKWRDGNHTRYTAAPREVSLVDSPCIPDATFELVKADGAVQQIKLGTGELVKVDPFASARDLLAKANVAVEIPDPDAPFNDALVGWLKLGVQFGKVDGDPPTDDMQKALSAWTSHVDSTTGFGIKNAIGDVTAALLLRKMKDGDEDVFAGLSLAKETLRGQALEKGAWTCASIGTLLQNLNCLQPDVAGETRFENDNSPVPADLAKATKEVGRVLVAMVQDEVNELVELAGTGDVALAAKPDDLLKAAQDELGANKLALAGLQKTFNELETKFKSTQDDLNKAQLAVTESAAALTKINGEVNELKKTITARDEAITELKSQVKAPTLRVVGKGDDVVVPSDDLKKVQEVKSGSGETDPAATIIKAIHATGGQKAAR